LDDFAADLALRTDGADRLRGKLLLLGQDDGGLRVDVDVQGDVAPLFMPEYAGFFGPQISLQARALRQPSGQLDLSALSLQARALMLEGSASIASDGLPLRFSLTGKLGLPDGGAVLLPVSGDVETRVIAANIDVGFDASQGAGWRGSVTLAGLSRADVTLDRATIEGTGSIIENAEGAVVDGNLDFSASGVDLTAPALAQALGRDLTGRMAFSWQQGGLGLRIDALDVNGAGYGISAMARFNSLKSGLRTTGTVTARYDDLARLSALAARPLAGAAELRLSGQAVPLGGQFDVVGSVKGTDLGLGIAQLDTLLRGQSTIDFAAARSTSGTFLRQFDVTAQSLVATASGELASDGSDLAAKLRFGDLSALGPQYGGSLIADASFTGTPARGRVTVTGQGQGLKIGNPQADRLLQGQSTLNATATLDDGRILVEEARLSNPQLTAAATGNVTGDTRQVALQARLANLALLIPEFPGAVDLAGTATQTGDGITLDLSGTGPGGINAQVSGRIAPGFDRANLTLTGTAQAALANAFLGQRSVSGPTRFNLALNGPLALSSLSGTAELSGGRFSAPTLPFGLQDMVVTANLGGNTVRLNGTARASSGGTFGVTGSIGLAAPNTADLQIALRDIIVRDPDLYNVQTSGALTVQGPLTGGAVIGGEINVREAELRVPSTGFTAIGALPELQHVNEPAPVRTTRRRAGLIETGGNGNGSTARPFCLNLRVSAPSRVFIRGRGIDAELGGTVTLRGDTSDVIASGSFDLIRGRLDILGQRLVLDQAQLLLQGDLIPTLNIVATNQSEDVTTSVVIEGPADDPQITFRSSPELPQEEVLARLLFGRGLENISALQAAQLANAVATLAGRGGEGIVGRLRKGFGLDDFDVGTDDEGNVTLKAGKYISKRAYTEVEVDQKGRSKINLNLDLKKGVTVRGSVDADGQAGIGVFVERDY
jgi:translocation and assembly module TamB